jgi:hypothetical protein
LREIKHAWRRRAASVRLLFAAGRLIQRKMASVVSGNLLS